jgi:cytochrome c-type biogenesis protein CcmH/NrfG
MTQTRRQMLEKCVAANPADAFARYGLAMDCMNAGETAAALDHFQALLAAQPHYLPAYFQYGQLLARAAQTAEARRILQEGITVAEKAGNHHTLSELQAALAELG